MHGKPYIIIIWMHIQVWFFFSILRQNEYYIIDTTVCKIPVYTCNISTHMHRHYSTILYQSVPIVNTS